MFFLILTEINIVEPAGLDNRKKSESTYYKNPCKKVFYDGKKEVEWQLPIIISRKRDALKKKGKKFVSLLFKLKTTTDW